MLSSAIEGDSLNTSISLDFILAPHHLVISTFFVQKLPIQIGLEIEQLKHLERQTDHLTN